MDGFYTQLLNYLRDHGHNKVMVKYVAAQNAK